MRTAIIFSIALLTFLTVSCAKKEILFTLVSADHPCTIVVNLDKFDNAEQAAAAYQSINWQDGNKQEDNACRQAFAALELQQYMIRLLKLSAAEIKIVDQAHVPLNGNLIFIGLPSDDQLKSIARTAVQYWRKNKQPSAQSFRIDSFNAGERNGLILSGKSSIGALYAVYELLQRWGVRWFLPEDEGDYVPHLNKIEVYNVHEFLDPSMEFRGFWMDAKRTNDQTDLQFIQWLGRNRINVYRSNGADIAALKLRGIMLNTGRRDLTAAQLTAQMPYPYNHPRMANNPNLPTDPYMISEQFHGDTNNNGFLEYGEAHPEWFVVHVDTTGSSPLQNLYSSICLSQSDAVKELSRLLTAEFISGQYQENDILDLWAPDEWCTCEKCSKLGNPADKMLYLLYIVGNTLKEARKSGGLHHPVYLFGYGQSAEHDAPTIDLPGNFNWDFTRVFLSTWPRCYHHHIINSDCVNINLWFIKELLGWLAPKSKFRGNLGIMENYNADAFHSLPTIYSEITSIDIPAYHELGIRGMSFMHARIHDLGVDALLNYQFSQMTWNTEIQLDTLSQSFIRFAYPGVAEVMAAFYENLEKSMSTLTTWTHYLPLRAPILLKAMRTDPENRRIHYNEQFDWRRSAEEPLFNELWENGYFYIFEARDLLNMAMAETLSPPVSRRLQELDNQLRYAELMINTYDNIISFFTSGPEEEDIRLEAMYRLRENRRNLLSFSAPNSLNGVSNGLEDCGIKGLIDNLLLDYADALDKLDAEEN